MWCAGRLPGVLVLVPGRGARDTCPNCARVGDRRRETQGEHMVLSSNLPSHSLKVERAREHLQTFEAEERIWLASKPYAIVDEPDPDMPLDALPDPRIQRRRFRVTHIDPVPDHLSLVFGDCVHNLRAALDHLALALAKAHTPTMTEKQIGTSEFPIFFDGPMTPKEQQRKIGCIAPAAAKVIERMQPHLRGQNYAMDPLWQIHDLDRIDKHRAPTVCVASSTDWPGYKKTADDNFGQWVGGESIGGVFKPGAVMLRISLLPADPNRDVKLQPDVACEIAFYQEAAAQPQPVVLTLNALCDFVSQGVIAKLSRFL
jgi:hypothetical protein